MDAFLRRLRQSQDVERAIEAEEETLPQFANAASGGHRTVAVENGVWLASPERSPRVDRPPGDPERLLLIRQREKRRRELRAQGIYLGSLRLRG